MSAPTPATPPMQAVTVSREYGSGGGEIARRLAQHLGWRLVDHEVVVRLAQELQISEDEAALHDEYAESPLERILANFQLFDASGVGGAMPPVLFNLGTYHAAVVRIIAAVTHAGPAVIVGRTGQFILRDQPAVLHVRIVAPLEQRIAYVMQREALDRAAAQARIKQKDESRARLAQTIYHASSADAHHYDLVLNSHTYTFDDAVDLIAAALDRKARRQGQPAAPPADIGRYPAAPEDLPAPQGQA